MQFAAGTRTVPPDMKLFALASGYISTIRQPSEERKEIRDELLGLKLKAQ